MMTARRSRCAWLVAFIAFATGCGGREPEGLSWHDELEQRDEKYVAGRIQVLSSSTAIEERRTAAHLVGLVCCQTAGPRTPRLRPQACHALAQVLEERDPELVETVLSLETPSCHAAIPVETILGLCSGGCTPYVRTWMHDWLEGADPSPEVVKAILAQIHPPPDGVDPHGHSGALTRALGSFGEDDLGPVVDLMSDPDPFVRDVAVNALGNAIGEGPLDLPEALAALEQAKNDPEEALASYAETIAGMYGYRRESPNETVVRFIADGELTYAEIRMLAVRRFSCKAISARPVLELVASGWQRDVPAQARGSRGSAGWRDSVDDSTMIAARRALAIRAKRCGH